MSPAVRLFRKIELVAVELEKSQVELANSIVEETSTGLK